MSLELANTLATIGTFVVIAATAIAAVLQLRHARSSNQIAALNELRETTETPEYMEAAHFVQGGLGAKLRDPAFRYQVTKRSARTDETRALIAKANALYRARWIPILCAEISLSRMATIARPSGLRSRFTEIHSTKSKTASET